MEQLAAGAILRKNKESKRMYLMEAAITADGQCLAMIYMRTDGMFEGCIHQNGHPAELAECSAGSLSEDFKICAVTETLPRVKSIVDEELERMGYKFQFITPEGFHLLQRRVSGAGSEVLV